MANQPDYDVSTDTIFISGLPEDVTEDQLAELFGQIGVIKFDKKNDCKKIWIYKDKTTGKNKGEATVTYDDPHTASSAINWFDGKEFRGSNLKVELAQRKSAPQFSRGGFRGRGGPRIDGGGRGDGGGYDRGGFDRARQGGGPSGRPGDWLCPTCNNNNFAYRQECNRCKTQKPHSLGSDNGGGRGSQYNGSRRSHNDNSRGSYRGGGGSSYRDNNRDNYRDRDRNRDGGYSSESRSGGAGGSGAGGPSRSHTRVDRDDRRQRPY